MRILFLTNNNVSQSLYEWIKNIEEYVYFFNDKIDIEKVKRIKPDMIISYNYKYIIKPDIIKFMDKRIINLHISLLPWNKGADPNVWSFLDNTPKGVTIHIVDEGLDTGDVLVQKKICFDESKETLASSYNKLHKEIQELFIENWDSIKKWNITPRVQFEVGTKHFAREFNEIKNKLKISSWDMRIDELKCRYRKYININS